MNEEFWERPLCWLCDKWWILLMILLVGVAGFLTRNSWFPLLVPPTPGTSLESPIETLITTPRTGDIQVTLSWNSVNDLDLWMWDPNGEFIYYQNKQSTSGGELDIDANPDCNTISNAPIENIFWPTGVAPRGHYRVEVRFYRRCDNTSDPVPFHVRLLVDGIVKEFDKVIANQGDIVTIYEFSR